jgi:hypothetical protein
MKMFTINTGKDSTCLKVIADNGKELSIAFDTSCSTRREASRAEACFFDSGEVTTPSRHEVVSHQPLKLVSLISEFVNDNMS